MLFVNFVNTYEQCQQDKIYVLEGAINEFWDFEATDCIYRLYRNVQANIFMYLPEQSSMSINKVDSNFQKFLNCPL